MRPLTLALIAFTASPAMVVAENPVDNPPYSVDTEATATAETQDEACNRAFDLAREDALNQIDQRFDTGEEEPMHRVELHSREDIRLGEVDEGFECRVIGQWVAIPTGVTVEETDDSSLYGGIETIRGKYQADCISEDNGAACRRQIEREAAADLKDDLIHELDLNAGDIELVADGFEGSQSYRYKGRDLTLTMDGTFYYRIEEPGPAARMARAPKPSGTEGEISVKSEQDKKDHFTDNLDFTVFYNWDGNDSAAGDELALSTNRWGVGLWVNNRFGFSAFWGQERAGIADSNGDVHLASDRYDVQGIGIGYRVFENRAVTLENMVHFVDAEPYSTQLNPGCSGCTPREYDADDYYQASINLKTNTEGLNIGWQLTWKLRDDLSQYDSLSGGWYLELQF
ncbi:hypothetical protein [Saccharospirillum salsuginis]|uniref:Uncharacterized protein n=1 Tax=Saccharospirillum salsuginis TaxID=418750 RepID=A0A918N7G7_9GAMM|nr:hypothetical protein [Saccharospirillum salsuginis]GGX43317.1 hypothetical protein GCM10007392_07560 [Saccharospirillum salsuginis]